MFRPGFLRRSKLGKRPKSDDARLMNSESLIRRTLYYQGDTHEAGDEIHESTVGGMQWRYLPETDGH